MNGTAVVVGGGIGGLATAVALHRIGWTATVLEAADRPREVGAGLSLSPNALRALDAIGLGTAARAIGVPSWASHTVRNPSGRHLMRPPDRSDPPLRAFRRGDLHRMLADAVPAGWLRTEARVLDVDTSADRPIVRHTGGELAADLVVGADGIHSTVRGLLRPDAPGPRFLHRAGWLGLADTTAPVGPGGAEDLAGSLTLGPHTMVLLHPVAAHQVYWAVLVHADRPGTGAPSLAQVRDRVGDWHHPIPELLAGTPEETVRWVDIHGLPPLPSYVSGPVALLGDAAHAMSPDRGQGAGQSIEDATVLAAALAGSADVRTALARYDAERRPRTQATVRDAEAAGRRVLEAGPVARALTALMMRAMPAGAWDRVTARGLGWLWDWTPPAVTSPATPS